MTNSYEKKRDEAAKAQQTPMVNYCESGDNYCGCIEHFERGYDHRNAELMPLLEMAMESLDLVLQMDNEGDFGMRGMSPEQLRIRLKRTLTAIREKLEVE